MPVRVAVVSADAAERDFLGRELARERRIRVVATLDDLTAFLAVAAFDADVLLLDPSTAGPDHAAALDELAARVLLLGSPELPRPVTPAAAFAAVLGPGDDPGGHEAGSPVRAG